MPFTLTIETDGAAFADDVPAYEVARILGVLSDLLKVTTPGSGAGSLRDLNGNTCGSWSLR